MARTQTIVQLTDELLAHLDRRAAADGVSRSQVIRRAVEAYVAVDRLRALDEAIVDGYRRHPQEAGPDAWGDLARWSDATARDNAAALSAEEGDDGW